MEHSTLQGRFQARLFWTVLALLALAVFPLVAPALGLDFYISFVRRVLIYALAATSLNLILGYGGMVALGHAAFFGAGAYAVGILAMNGVTSALVAWPAAALLAGLLAAATGAVSLRTRGVYFIMITLAFAQMLFYIFISLRQPVGHGREAAGGPAAHSQPRARVHDGVAAACGQQRAIVATGPMPGSTPMSVPSRQPTKQ